MKMTHVHTFLSSCLEVGRDCLFLSYMEAPFIEEIPQKGGVLRGHT